jgi:hypothetical protein
MQANLMKMGFGLLYSLATAVVFLVLFSGSPAVAAGEGEAFIVLPGEPTRYTGQKGREGDFTELLATADRTGGVLGFFRQTIAPKSGPPTHLHEMEAEFCYVVSGQFNFKLGGTHCERARRSLRLHSSHYSAHVPEHRDGARCIAVRCGARWVRNDVRGAARCGCRYEPEADGKAPHASRGATPSVDAAEVVSTVLARADEVIE